MYDFRETEPSTPQNGASIVMIVLAFTLMGSCLGIMIADQEALAALKTKTASLFSADTGSLFANLKAAISGNGDQGDTESPAQAEAEVIPTGLSAVGAIHYSPKADLTRMVFDLQDMELIGTGKLTDPHRIYVDLQDIYWEPDSFKGIKTLKALDINGDLVSRVRIKKRESGVMRIVLDLKQFCHFTYQVPEDSPSRLIVQLQPAQILASVG